MCPISLLIGARARRLMRLAKACPDFAPLVEGICVAPDPLEHALAEELRQLTHPKQWLMALHLTCTYLAAKNVDKVPASQPLCPACLFSGLASALFTAATAWLHPLGDGPGVGCNWLLNPKEQQASAACHSQRDA